MVNRMLTTREFQIATKLLDTEKTLRTKDLSTQLNVSTRTIKSDLDNVRKWFQKNNAELFAQPNKGYWIKASKNERLKLYHTLMDMENKPEFSNPNQRIQKILYLFFLQNGFITAAQLSTHLQVSRNTVLSDLNDLEYYIQPWKVHLERKQRIGYRIVGEELHIRLLFEHLIQESLSNFNVYKISSQIKSDQMTDMDYGLIPEIQEKFEIVINHFQKMKNQKALSQPEALSIILRLIIFLVRMEREYTIGSYRLLKVNQHNSSPSSIFVFKVMKEICEEYSFPVLEDEFMYVHRNYLQEDNEINLLVSTEKIIHYVSEKERIPYYKDTKLFNNLLAHLSLRFEKNTTYVSEVNPFIDEMKQYHFSLFKEIKAACEKVFPNTLNVIQDTFISFIALHFLNSYENVFDRKSKIRALYVCSTGRGVARLIKNRVEREIKDFTLTSYCSVTEVEETCENENIDLIISVFPIKSDIPVIIVEPVPTKENIQAIQEEVDNLLQGRETVEPFLLEEGDDYQFEIDTEIISQEIIIKGFEVSDEIMTTLAYRVTEEHKKGLNVHLFLMIHRYYFNKQYDQFIHQSKEQNEELLEQINAILHKHNIYIKESEQRALLEYFN